MVPSSPARSSWRQTVKGTPEWHHTTYPRTDWQSGPWVTLKNGLKVAVESGVSAERALARFLLAYRSSPHAATGRAPAELLYGRNQRTRLNLLIPCAETTLQAARDDQHRAAGGRAREFQFEATVWVRSYGGRQKWVRSKVIACSGPASYEVDVDDAVWSRHVDQLLAASSEPGAGAEGPSRVAPAGGEALERVGGAQTMRHWRYHFVYCLCNFNREFSTLGIVRHRDFWYRDVLIWGLSARYRHVRWLQELCGVAKSSLLPKRKHRFGGCRRCFSVTRDPPATQGKRPLQKKRTRILAPCRRYLFSIWMGLRVIAERHWNGAWVTNYLIMFFSSVS